MVGEVFQLGAGVESDSAGHELRVGDRILFPAFYPCARCRWCTSGEINMCPYRRRDALVPAGEFPCFTGGFADFYYLRPRHWVFKAPANLSIGILSLINCSASTVAFGMLKLPPLLGLSVSIHGLGALGHFALIFARQAGATTISGVDTQAARVRSALRFGLDTAVPPCMADGSSHVASWEFTSTARVPEHDIAICVTGESIAFTHALQILRPGGTLLSIGNIKLTEAIAFSPALITTKRISVIGVELYDPWTIPRVLQILTKEFPHTRLDDIVSHTFDLENINEAFHAANWSARSQTDVIRAMICP